MKKHDLLYTKLLLAGFCLLSAAVAALALFARGRLPDTVGRALTAQEASQVIARNSPLTDYVFLTPNADFPRAQPISKITVHHMAGDLGLEELGAAFAQRDRSASSNYAIDSSGRVALYVEEANRAWTSGSEENDSRAVTIEVANDQLGGQWHVSDAAFDALVELCADICRRNGIQALMYTGDAEGTLTTHRMFSDATLCPGPYLESRLPDLVSRVNALLGHSEPL